MAKTEQQTAIANVLAGVFEAARQVAPLIVPGATVPSIIAAGEALVKAIDAGADLIVGTYPPNLVADRDALEAKVRAHVADTASRLRG